MIAAIALALPMTAFAQFVGPGPGGGPGARPGGGPGSGDAPGSRPRLEVVASFDVDGDGILNAEERVAALEYVRSANVGRARRSGPMPEGRLPQAVPGGRRPEGAPGGVPSQAAAPEPGIAVAPEDVASHDGVALYDTGVLRTIFIDFAFEGWEDEMAAFYGTDVELPATVTIDGVAYRDVGVRFRGNSSFSRVSAGQKRPLRLKLDRVHADQNVEGFRTLNLHNGTSDSTSIRTALYSTISQDYLPTPRVALVQVVIDGELWGVYQHQQQFNSDFERDWFGQTGGVRWKVPGSPNGRGGMVYLGDDPEAYQGFYEIDNRDTPESWAALIELFRVLDETPVEDLVETLEPILDLDGVLRFLALDVALVNSDGYWTRASDYYIYLDPDGRFHVFAHDLNEGLGTAGFGRGGFPGGGGGSASATLDPLVGIDDPAKALRSRLLAVPELRKRYLEYVLDVAERWLDWTTLAPVAQGMTDLIDDVVRAETRGLYAYETFAGALDGPTASLRSFVEQRRGYLLATVPDQIAAIAADAYVPSAISAASGAPASVLAPADGWHVTVGTGSVALVDTATGATSAFVFEDLTANFGDAKLDQCVPIDDDAPFTIAFSVLAATPGEDASGLAVRVNPNFHADVESCLEAIALDAGGRRLGDGRANDDIDLVLGATDGNRWSYADEERLRALRYEADAIPAGATFVRLSLRARDRSDLGTGTSIAFDDVSLVQAGVDRVRDGGFEASP